VISMTRGLVLTIIVLSAVFIAGLYLLIQYTGGTTFEDRFNSVKTFTFSIGEGTRLKQDLRIEISLGNRSVVLQRINRTIEVSNFTWPHYTLCEIETSDPRGPIGCYDTPFTLVAIPKELLGVDAMNIPFPLAGGEESYLTVHYNGLTEIETEWGPHTVVNYTNVTLHYPRPNTNTTAKLYFDSMEGYMVRIEMEITDGTTTSIGIYELLEMPNLGKPFQIDRPDTWEWGFAKS